MNPSRRSRKPVLVIDTREQRPYDFDNAVVRALPAGDYSVDGCETRVAIERKSLEDAYASLGYARARFEREIERLSHYEYAAVVVEASLPGFLIAPEFSRLRPKSAICSLLAFSVKYRLPIFFCGDRAHGEATTRHLLTKFARYAEEGRIGRDERARDEPAA